MARGWESKGIESQIEEFEAARKAAKEDLRTPEQIALERQRDSLLLSRKRVLDDIAKSRTERHRQMLEESLAVLDAKLAEL